MKCLGERSPGVCNLLSNHSSRKHTRVCEFVERKGKCRKMLMGKPRGKVYGCSLYYFYHIFVDLNIFKVQ